ncbi:protein huluwa [Syngnathus typhle]|uniref:protein huluwa n=1 Tax=Syngnathus typhle TaxID=161592 RepID=UPI002A6B398A|nr:protein huluwa [Syngnathus typhle]
MSQPGQSTAPSPSLSEGYPVVSLTLVVLLLIPAVIVLLLLNCLFLGYKLFLLSKARPRPPRRKNAKDFLFLESVLPRRTPDTEGFSTRRPYMSLSEPVLPQPPVTSSRASSSGRQHGISPLRPGSGSLRAPSSIRAARPSMGEWRHSAPVLPQSSESEADNVVPPNSPTSVYKEVEHMAGIHQSSTYRMLTELSPGAVHRMDQAHMECRSYLQPPSEGSCPNTLMACSGLDSDFGASAGVSLRILSEDSDGLSNGVLASALEWDYYDYYVKQNNVPKHKHQRPAMHTKQYWV